MTTTLIPEALPAFTAAVRGSARLQRHWLDSLTAARTAEIEDLLAHDIRLGVLVFPDMAASCQVVAMDRTGAYSVLMRFEPDSTTQTSN